MRGRQHTDCLVSIATERPAHHTYKCLVLLSQLHDLLCHRICVVLITTGVCNQQANLYAIRKFEAIVELLLRYISALQVVSSHAHSSTTPGEHRADNDGDVRIT